MAESLNQVQGQSSCQDGNFHNSGTNVCISSSFEISKGLSSAEKPFLLATKDETCFSHFSRGSIYCCHLKALQAHLLNTTELKLTQECLKRFVCAFNFKEKLENYAENELTRLNIIYCHGLSKNRGLNLDYFHKVCREAKIHLFHWQHVEYKISQQPLPVRYIVLLRTRIQRFKQSFLCLRRKILHWLHMIAVAGVRVLANASFKQLSSTVDLQNFLQGIEEFNHIISAQIKQSADSINVYGFNTKNVCAVLRSALPTLDLVEILSVICVERSKLLARLTHEHFVQESKAVELQDFLSATNFSWNPDKPLSSQDLLECTGNVRYGKLQLVIKKYGHKEEEFIKQLMGTASVCAVLHHENEIKRQSNEFCEKHNQTTCGRECSLVQANCLACQMKQNSIKALMDGSDPSEYYEAHEVSTQTMLSPARENQGSNQDLRALFMESKPSKAKFQLFAIYRDDLWNKFGSEFYSVLEMLQWPYATNTGIGPLCSWSTAVVIGITQHFDNLAATGPFTEVGMQSVQHISHSLYLRSVLSCVDGCGLPVVQSLKSSYKFPELYSFCPYVLCTSLKVSSDKFCRMAFSHLYLSLTSLGCFVVQCLMIAIGQQDKCKPAAIVDGVSCTKTAGLMVQACSVFQHFFTTASYWEEFTDGRTTSRSPASLPVRVKDVFDGFGLFLNFCIFWFTTKLKQFLASWSLQQYFVVSQYDMSLLMKAVNATLQLMEQMHCQLGNVSDHAIALKCHWNEMERKAGFLQIIEVDSWESFKHKFIRLASEFWKEMMPKGRLWKRSRNSGNLPSTPSSYVEHAIIQVLQPVIEGVSKLPQGLQNSILIQTVEIMMDTWSSYILKEQIKFSVIGAYQLQVDFNYVKLWLTSDASTLSTSVQSDLAVLDVFRHLNEAVRLLMIQPKNKRKRIIVNENGLEPEIESNLSTISGSSLLSGTSSYDGETDLLNNQVIPNKDQWLNLRLRKGKSRVPLVIPACLRSSEQT